MHEESSSQLNIGRKITIRSWLLYWSNRPKLFQYIQTWRSLKIVQDHLVKALKSITIKQSWQLHAGKERIYYCVQYKQSWFPYRITNTSFFPGGVGGLTGLDTGAWYAFEAPVPFCVGVLKPWPFSNWVEASACCYSRIAFRYDDIQMKLNTTHL